MGQSNPKDNRRQVRGGIYIQLQQTAFVSNQVIQGFININLEEPYKGHILQITLSGIEETHFTYTVKSGKDNRTSFAKGLNNFLNFSIPVYDFSQGSNDPNFIIQPCQAVIPFQLDIAGNLPSSMKFFKSEHNQCQIKYSLIASIIPTESNLKPVQGIQEIFIGQQITTFELPNTTTSTQQPVVCCCCKQGQINYNITTNSRSFAPNENILLKMQIDFSQFSKKVKNINVELLGQLTMKADNNFRDKKFQIFEKNMSVQVDDSKVNQEVSIQVPSDITLSSQGQLLSVVYSLRITPDINTCCVSNSQPHEIIIYINPYSNQHFNYNGIPQQLQVKAPQNWNPVQLQPTQFSKQQSLQIQQQQSQFFAQEQQYLLQANGSQEQPLYEDQYKGNKYMVQNPMTNQNQQMINQNQNLL
ncbi:hypothetical protein ABPG74_019809 [Tetrahymena malaccensis]